tara:strand:+ start:353 stop:979 length:627 start_codon:yes stop_codon:yes gene_type:complete
MYKNKKTEIGGLSPTNGAEELIALGLPYRVLVSLQGCADFLFHRWNNESIAEKSAAAKGSKAKKTDDIESYVYRNDNGNLCIPGEYLRQSCIEAAKYKQDPRSPRKSAKDLYKAGIISLTNLSDLGLKDWDYEDKRRVVIQRNGITRTRPAMKKGWKSEFEILVNVPEYISPEGFLDTINTAGKLVGLGDFRPSFGRFQVIKFEVLNY